LSTDTENFDEEGLLKVIQTFELSEAITRLDISGPFDFNKKNVEQIRSETGNYALGHMTDEKKFRPDYVGRSDFDLQDELFTRLKTHGHHKKFKYSYAKTRKEAFEKECKNFHEFEPSENENHPDRPDGTGFKCPFPKYH